MAEAGGKGTLQVTVVKGKRLAVRDFKTSDRYLILELGTQVAKTKVINNCLNPVWDKDLTFSLQEPAGVLNLASQILIMIHECVRVNGIVQCAQRSSKFSIESYQHLLLTFNVCLGNVIPPYSIFFSYKERFLA